jgi:ribose transport system substrate-binding protein
MMVGSIALDDKHPWTNRLFTEVEGSNGTYRPMGYPSISYASPPYSGALALKLAVDVLDGKQVEKTTILPLPLVTNETVKLCKEGTWAEMKAGCNVFNPAIVSNPGWFASIFSDQTPEIGLNAALVGQPED